jgi:acyl carrier protein
MSSPPPEFVSRDQMLALVVQAAEDLTKDWDRALSDPPGPTTLLIADLGCQSLDIVMLTAAMSRQLHRSDIPFERLLLRDGRPVDDLSLGAIADFLWQNAEPKERLSNAGLGAIR